jgi:hypothetical protein
MFSHREYNEGRIMLGWGKKGISVSKVKEKVTEQTMLHFYDL